MFFSKITQRLYSQQIYPFIIAFSSLFILLIINGLTTTNLSTFDEKLIQEFAWSRSEAKLRDWVTSGVAFVFIFFSGMVLDRVGPRKMLIFACITLSIALFLYGSIQSKFHAYCIHFLLGIALITGGSVPSIMLVSSWFHTKKGLALGLTLAGTSLGGILFPQIIVRWMNTYGWRVSFEYLAIFPLVLLAWVLIFVHNTPADKGLLPYGYVAAKDTNPVSFIHEGMDYQKAIGSSTLWLICTSGFLSFFSLVGVVSNSFLHFRDLGFTEKKAALALSIYFGLAGLGKFIVATFSDYTNVFFIFRLCFFSMTLGLVGFATMHSDLAYIAIGITGLSWGGMYTLYNLITVKTFGLKAFGKINGIVNMCESVGAAFGPLLMGKMYDYTGSYQIGFMVMSGFMLIAGGLTFKFNKTI
jgi:sugar phosphate permease